MHVFTKRNALLGWLVARVARRRLERRLRAVVARPEQHRFARGAGAVAAAVAVGAIAARRFRTTDARPA